jgi:hypothetical protein
MTLGERVFRDFDLKDENSILGMESRSILKSIQTEEAKLAQSTHPTRSDLHYFRARHNYYRLSLLRLPAEERDLLEPVLGRFFERIVTFEQLADGPIEKTPAPFLQTVEKKIEVLKSPSVINSPVLSAPVPTVMLDEVISQLQLVRLALTGEYSIEAKKVLCDGLDRIISKLKSK